MIIAVIIIWLLCGLLTGMIVRYKDGGRISLLLLFAYIVTGVIALGVILLLLLEDIEI